MLLAIDAHLHVIALVFVAGGVGGQTKVLVQARGDELEAAADGEPIAKAVAGREAVKDLQQVAVDERVAGRAGRAELVVAGRGGKDVGADGKAIDANGVAVEGGKEPGDGLDARLVLDGGLAVEAAGLVAIAQAVWFGRPDLHLAVAGANGAGAAFDEEGPLGVGGAVGIFVGPVNAVDDGAAVVDAGAIAGELAVEPHQIDVELQLYALGQRDGCRVQPDGRGIAGVDDVGAAAGQGAGADFADVVASRVGVARHDGQNGGCGREHPGLAQRWGGTPSPRRKTAIVVNRLRGGRILHHRPKPPA